MKTETWIYLFFIFLTIILPLIRGSKKKKAAKTATPAPAAPPAQEDIFQNLEKELKKMQESISGNISVEEAPYASFDESTEDFQEEEMEKPFSYDDEYQDHDFIPDEETVLSEEETLAVKSSYSVSPEYLGYEQGKKETSGFRFNPVEAVIYSEILKRPEY